MSLDSANQLLVVSLDGVSIQMKVIKTKFIVMYLGNNKDELVLSIHVSNPDSEVLMKSIFGMIGDRLKKFHEL